jgi:hypothetical protein
MAYVIGKPYIDVVDRACVEAIFYEDDLPEQWSALTADNARFFAERPPGRDAPLNSPGGAAKLHRLGVDTVLVASYPPQTP